MSNLGPMIGARPATGPEDGMTLVGRSVLVLFLREVPIWTYGPIYDFLGRYVRDGWSPRQYGEWEFGSQVEAEQFLAARGDGGTVAA